MQADGRAWLYAPTGLVDGPLPTHYEPQESPFDNPLYAPAVQPGAPAAPPRREPVQPGPRRAGRDLPLRPHDLPPDRAPHGGRDVAQAALPGRAAARVLLRGLAGAGGRARPGARRLGDDRHPARGDRGARAGHRADPPAAVGARRCHQVGLPYHWGSHGLATGDSANDLLALALDPNVQIGEYKARPATSAPGAGRAARRCSSCVDEYRRRATQASGSEPPEMHERP